MEAVSLMAVYLFSCVAAIWLARRWVGAFSRRFGIALVLLPLALTGRALLTGGCLAPLNISYHVAPLQARAGSLPPGPYDDGILSDVACSFIPWAKAVRESVKHFRAPLLNRFMLGGDILLATIQPGVFHPNTVLGFLLPLATALTFRCAFTFFLAGLFAFLYFSEIGVSEEVAFLGACGWAYCGFVLFWVGWNVSSAIAPLPLLLLGLRRLARSLPHGFALVVTALLLSVLAGHPETLLHVVAAGGIVFLLDLVRAPRRGRAVGSALAAGLLTLGLSAVSLLPFAEALPQTGDYLYRQSDYAHQQKSVPLRAALHGAVASVYPSTYGPMWSFAPEKPPDDLAATGAFVGGLLLVLAPVGLLSRRRERWPLATGGALCALVGYGFPGVADWVSRLPLFDIAINNRLLGFLAFFLVALAVLGMDALLRREARAGFFVLIAGLLVLLGFGIRRALFLSASGGGHAPSFLVSLALLTAPGLLVAVLLRRFRRRPPTAAALAVGVFLVFHLAEMPRLYPTFPASLFFPKIPELDRLPRGGEPYRVVGLGMNLLPNESALYELEDPRGYTSMNNERYTDASWLWSIPQPVWFNRVDDPTRPFLSFLNVRFAVAGPAEAAPPGWRVRERGPDCAVFENPKVLPRAFAPARVRFVPDANRTIEQMKACPDFSSVAWIEDASRSAGEAANGVARVAVRQRGPDLHLTIDAASPTWVVVSQTSWKGWHASEGGRDLPLRFANQAFIGLRVESGHHEVALRYRPRSFSLGLAITGMSLLILAAIRLRRRDRGRPALPE